MSVTSVNARGDEWFQIKLRGGDEKKVFFFEKKNQKTFIC